MDSTGFELFVRQRLALGRFCCHRIRPRQEVVACVEQQLVLFRSNGHETHVIRKETLMQRNTTSHIERVYFAILQPLMEQVEHDAEQNRGHSAALEYTSLEAKKRRCPAVAVKPS